MDNNSELGSIHSDSQAVYNRVDRCLRGEIDPSEITEADWQRAVAGFDADILNHVLKFDFEPTPGGPIDLLMERLKNY